MDAVKYKKNILNIISVKKKYVLCTFIFVILIGLLSACSHTSASDSTDKESADTKYAPYIDEEKKHISLDMNDYVHIDADYSIPDVYADLKMNRIVASRPLINEEKCKEIFLGDRIIEPEIDSGYYSREIGNYDTEYYNDSDVTLSLEKMDMFACRYDSEKIENCLFEDERFDSYNLDKYSLDKELSFGSRDEIFKWIKKTFKDAVGIDVSDNYKAYALDHKTLYQEQNAHLDLIEEGGSATDQWSEEDDAYYFVLCQDVDGVPIYQEGYGDIFEGIGVDYTQLTVLYNKNGWLDFWAERGYCIEKTEEEQKIISLEQALESLNRKFELNVDQGEEWNINHISLQLVPVHINGNNYEIKPVWMFQGINPKIMFGFFNIMIDAVSGKEIVQET